MRQPNTWENMFLGCTVQEIPRLIPGLVLTAALTIFVILLTDLVNSALGFKGLISYILIVIVLGILLRNLITVPPVFMPGIGFCVKKLLRLEVVAGNMGVV